MPNPQVSLLLTLIDQAFDHQSGYGTNLRGSIRGLSVADVVWRPAPNRHSIWEIVVHAAYWTGRFAAAYSPKPRLLSVERIELVSALGKRENSA